MLTLNRGLAAVCAVSALCCFAARAETYPDRTATLVIGMPPGGSVDLMSRLYAEYAGQAFGQQIIVDNRAGATGIVAASLANHARPDGYTLLLALGGLHTVTPFMESVPFDPVQGFEPITLLFQQRSFLVVPAKSDVHAIADLIALGRTKPEGLTYGSQGVGSPGHVLGSLFQVATHLHFVHAPYRGGAPMVTDLVAGRLDFAFSSFAEISSHVDSGTLRILAIAAPTRWPRLKDVRTTAELGYPSVQYLTWFGLMAPPKTPAPMIAAIREAFIAASKNPALVERMQTLGIEPVTSTPQQLVQQIETDTERLKPVIDILKATSSR